MGLIYAEIEIINGDDLVLSRKSLIGQEEIRRMNVKMMVDTGAINMCINENVQIKFKNRSTMCRAIVLPGDTEMLLGAIPMEDMDVVINARKQELDVNPESPDMAMALLPYLRSVDRPKINWRV